MDNGVGERGYRENGAHQILKDGAGWSPGVRALNELEHGVEDTRVLAFGGSFPRRLDHFISPFATTSWDS